MYYVSDIADSTPITAPNVEGSRDPSEEEDDADMDDDELELCDIC